MHTRDTSFFHPGMGARAAAAAVTAALALGGGAQAQPVGEDGPRGSSAVAEIVKVPKPWYAPRFVVLGRMRDTIPEYRALPGLAFKAYSFAQVDGHFGGIYLWKDLASARAWFTPAWFARVLNERGAPAEVRFFEVAAAVDNYPGGTHADPDSASVAILSLAPLPPGADRRQWMQQVQETIGDMRQVSGLLRRHVVVNEQGRVGHISLWRDLASARQWFNHPAYGTVVDAAVEWFDTPILLPSAIPENQPRVPGL